ncbi:MAG: hypothetical protein ABFE01_17080 [Phycisphaerales bacterium]
MLEYPTLSAAAIAAGVDRKTIRRWMGLPEFRRRLRESRDLVYEHAMARLTSQANNAVTVLSAAMLAQPLKGKEVTPLQAKAAAKLLSLAKTVRLEDVDELHARLSELLERYDKR